MISKASCVGLPYIHFGFFEKLILNLYENLDVYSVTQKAYIIQIDVSFFVVLALPILTKYLSSFAAAGLASRTHGKNVHFAKIGRLLWAQLSGTMGDELCGPVALGGGHRSCNHCRRAAVVPFPLRPFLFSQIYSRIKRA